MPTVFVANLPADSKLLAQSCLNRLAEFYGPDPQPGRRKFVHTELLFPDSDNRADIRAGIGARIVYNGRVEMGAKSFSRSSWNFLALSVTEPQRQAMLSWLHERQGAKFDYTGYFVGWHTSGAYYCSQLVGQCLRDCGVVPDLSDRDLRHPEALHQAIERKGHTFLDTPRALHALHI